MLRDSSEAFMRQNNAIDFLDLVVVL